jgi:hypothetical protein
MMGLQYRKGPYLNFVCKEGVIKPFENLKNVFSKAAVATAAPLLAASPAMAQGVEMASSGLGVGPLTFASPAALLFAAALPPVWWLMRSIPPKPKKEEFAAIRFLFNIKSDDQEPVKMPLWQRMMRISILGLAIAGLAQPQFDPDSALDGKGPIMVVVDNGWASSKNWESRVEQLDKLVDRAERDDRPVIILTTAASEDGKELQYSGKLNAEEARELLSTLESKPWPVDRNKALDIMENSGEDISGKEMSVVWLSNGLGDEGTLEFVQRLDALGDISVLEDDLDKAARMIAPVPVEDAGDKLRVTVSRVDDTRQETISLTARDEKGRAISQIEIDFDEGETELRGTFDIPVDLRNQLSEVSIDGDNNAGAVVLLDERWRRRPVGLLNTASRDSAQSLLNETNYIESALTPYSDVNSGTVDDLLENPLAVMIMTDSEQVSDEGQEKIDEWIQQGGTLLRFAGPRLASQTKSGTEDNLLPVELRPGERVVGGPVSGKDAGKLAPFDKDSPFYGIDWSGDITVEKEVLVQPEVDIDRKTWARLNDGTPLVTAEQRGKGWLVLIHTTADTDWSDLVLSGAFVDMMRVVVSNSQGVIDGPQGFGSDLPAFKVLNAKGELVTPEEAVGKLTSEDIAGCNVGPNTPPGFYGSENIRKAHNLASCVSSLQPITDIPENISRGTYKEAHKQNDLMGPLLTGALAFLLIDLLVLLGQKGHLPTTGRDGRKNAKKGNSPAPGNA